MRRDSLVRMIDADQPDLQIDGATAIAGQFLPASRSPIIQFKPTARREIVRGGLRHAFLSRRRRRIP